MSTRKIDRLIQQWHGEIAQAARVFEARWTTLALRRVNPDLAEALHEQRNIYTEACLRGTAEEIEEHGAATVRGFRAAIAAMEAAAAPDDAYLLGRCPNTGVQVAIGHSKASVDRVIELHGQDLVYISPDEVATLIATAEAFSRVAGIKRAFPGSEIVAVRYAAEGS